MTRRLIVLAVLFLLSATPLSAGHLSTYELGAFGGMFFGDSAAAVDDDLVYGLRAAITVTDGTQFELVYDRVDTTFESPLLGDIDEEFTSIAIHWIFNFQRARGGFMPYLFVGIGEIEDRVMGVEDDDSYIPWGGGFRALASRGLSVRVETRVKDFRTFGVAQDSWELTVGLSFHLPKSR